jgi:hypothetical protein
MQFSRRQGRNVPYVMYSHCTCLFALVGVKYCMHVLTILICLHWILDKLRCCKLRAKIFYQLSEYYMYQFYNVLIDNNSDMWSNSIITNFLMDLEISISQQA